ncbi:MAG TPA: iron-containing alcohol dehydrogenase family protein, partial [Bacillota bacterium]|nr:iron-containing alcohol dehydrogenase family protein [Bacillota bacterium]
MKRVTHRISIPSILEVGRGNLSNVGKHIHEAGFSKIAVFFGENIYSLFGERVMNSLIEAGIQVSERFDFDNNDLCAITEKAFRIPNETELIVGVGGGKVLDVAKYVGFLNDLPFLSVPTAPSNDGFSSSSASLLINGKRRTVSARMPFGIVVDIDVVKSAPMNLVYSGIGDLISKITAVYDWQFEEANGKTRVDDFAAMIAKKSVNSVVRMDLGNIKDEWFLKEIVDSLTMSGIAMEMAGNSAPASGSEHLISHALDQLLEKPQAHGIQVGVATYIMSRVQEYRVPRVTKFLSETGFFNYVKGLGMRADYFGQAIEDAPAIK